MKLFLLFITLFALNCNKDQYCKDCKYWYVYNGKKYLLKQEEVCDVDELKHLDNNYVTIYDKHGNKFLCLCKCN